MAANSPASEYNVDDDPNYDDASPVPSIPIHVSNPKDESDEVSQFCESSQDHGQQDDEIEQEEHISRPPSPFPAFANVLCHVPSNGSYAGSPLRQTVLGCSTRGGAMPMMALPTPPKLPPPPTSMLPPAFIPERSVTPPKAVVSSTSCQVVVACSVVVAKHTGRWRVYKEFIKFGKAL